MSFWEPQKVETGKPKVGSNSLAALQQRSTKEDRYPGNGRTFGSGRTVSGVYVTPQRALTNSTVWAAHRYLRETVGSLPAKVYRIERNGDASEVVDHPVLDLLEWRPNPELSPFGLRETLTGWAISEGNGIAEIERDGVGRAVAIWPIKPSRIEFLRDVETGELLYDVTNGSDGKVTLKSQDVFHIRGYGDGPVGMSVFDFAAQSIGWAKATELFGASFFGNGLHFGGTAILKDAAPDVETLEEIEARLTEKFQGPGPANGWFVGDGSMSITRMTATPDEAQFVTTMQHQVEEICRWMGVPPYKVHHLLRMTFNNVEQASIDVVSDSIVPWKKRWEQEATYKLFGGNRRNLRVVFDLTDLLKGDFKTMQEGFQVMRRNGVINADNWAERMQLPKPGPANGGDKYIVEKNMVETVNVGKNTKKKDDAATQSAPAPAPASVANPATKAYLNEALALLEISSEELV